jgi:hypothetical protein
VADLLPDPPTPSGGPWPRKWHRYEGYRLVHDKQHEALRSERVVLRDTVTFYEIRDRRGRLVEVNVKGRIKTRAGAILVVNKWLSVRTQKDRVVVRTREYDYHAFMRGPRRDLFRYDNCHGAPDTLHRHRFDVDGVAREDVPIPVAAMPLLAHVVREADFLARYLRRRLAR